MFDELRDLILKDAVVRGAVTLSSGQPADWYADLRRITLSAVGSTLVGRAMLALTVDWDYQAVGGLTLGADPVATAMMHAATARNAMARNISTRGRELDAFVVRATTKEHGLQKRIEGPDVAGRRVLVVEDTCTSGSSALTAVAALRDHHAVVVGVAAVLDRGGSHRVAEEGLPFRAAFDLADLGLT